MGTTTRRANMDCTCDKQQRESHISLCMYTYVTSTHTHAPPTHHTLFTTLTLSTLMPTHTHILLHTVIKKLHTHTQSHTATYLMPLWLSWHHSCSLSCYKTKGLHPSISPHYSLLAQRGCCVLHVAGFSKYFL